MRILITGGTGLIGTKLVNTLYTRDNEVTVLTRNLKKAKQKLGGKAEYITSLDSLRSLDDYEGVINLAGASIAGGRWTRERKQKLEHSRWDLTSKLAQLIKAGKTPPKVFISGSAVGYYGAHNGEVLTESSAANDDFTHRLCSRWESLAQEAAGEYTRVCLLRTGIVLSSDGGMLPLMSLPFKLFMGSVLGTGKQYISWIHVRDMIDAIIFLLRTDTAQGAFNMTSPEPVTNAVFSHTLADVLNRPCWWRIPPGIISLILGEMSTMILDGQRAVPNRLMEAGYNFEYPELKNALEDILVDSQQEDD